MQKFQNFQTTTDYSNGNQTKKQRGRDHGGRHLNAAWGIYVCTQDVYVHAHTGVDAVCPHFSVGKKVFHCPPTKNTEKGLVLETLTKM